MSLILRAPLQFNWIGHLDEWPVRDGDWQQKRQQVFERYKEWSRAIARKTYRTSVNKDMELADMEHYASVGLLESIERYKPELGVPFKAYAHKRIRGEILNHLSRFSEYGNQQAQKHQLMQERLSLIQGGYLPDVELQTVSQAASQNASEKASQKASLSAEESLVASIIDLAVGFLLEEPQEAKELVVGGQSYNSVEFAHFHEKTWQYMDCLPEIEKHILLLHYQKHTSFSDISQRLGLSSGRVSQLHKKALSALKQRLSWGL